MGRVPILQHDVVIQKDDNIAKRRFYRPVPCHRLSDFSLPLSGPVYNLKPFYTIKFPGIIRYKGYTETHGMRANEHIH